MIIHIHISLIHSNVFISNSNPYFWILNPIHLIGYGLDIHWIHFWIIQIAFWDVDSCRFAAKLI